MGGSRLKPYSLAYFCQTSLIRQCCHIFSFFWAGGPNEYIGRSGIRRSAMFTLSNKSREHRRGWHIYHFSLCFKINVRVKLKLESDCSALLWLCVTRTLIDGTIQPCVLSPQCHRSGFLQFIHWFITINPWFPPSRFFASDPLMQSSLLATAPQKLNVYAEWFSLF